MQSRPAAACGLILVSLLLGSCGGAERLAPVSRVDPVASSTPGTHTVRKGDTLYAIAWEHDLDYRKLAAWNRLPHPFLIHPGQVLNLRASPAEREPNASRATVSTAALPEPPNLDQRRLPEAESGAHAATPSPSPSGSGAGVVPGGGGVPPGPDVFDGGAAVEQWRWPTAGKVIGAFGKSGRKGIHLSGRYEQPVVAAADGRVVYSGAGLVGYGQLIVLKHNKHFFSAYAHNAEILVKEGDLVKGGQRIALMGSSGSDKVKLHFEIRHDGKPVDPLRFLPRRRS